MPGRVVFINNNFRLEARIQWGKTHVSKTVTVYGDWDSKMNPLGVSCTKGKKPQKTTFSSLGILVGLA